MFHIYVIRTKQRDALQEHLTKHGIGTMIHYPVPPHFQEAYRDKGWKQGQFPLAEEIAATCLSLPIFPGLTDGQIERVVAVIKAFFAGTV